MSDGADDAERDDQDDPEREGAPARRSLLELVDRRQPVTTKTRIARHLGADREDRRDDERGAVRTKEAEQAHERAPPRPSGLRRNLLASHLAVGYGSCSRRCRTCPRGATPRPLPRSARRSGRPRVFWPSTRTRTTTVRSTCSWRSRRASSTPSSPVSQPPGTSSICAATRACTRGSARPTSFRSSRSRARTFRRHALPRSTSPSGPETSSAYPSSSTARSGTGRGRSRFAAAASTSSCDGSPRAR